MHEDARLLLEADPFAAELGVRLLAAEGATAVVELQIQTSHVNFLGVAHGGVLFSLADIAMSIVANASRTEAVAIEAHVSYIRPARVGDKLRARAEEEHATGSTGEYRATIHDQEGGMVALFSGTVFRPDPY